MNCKSYFGPDTILELAISNDLNTEVIKAMFDAVDVSGMSDYTPLSWVLKYGQSPLVVKSIVKAWRRAERSLLLRAIYEGETEAVEILTASGIDVNVPSTIHDKFELENLKQQLGVKPLIYAIENGNSEIVRLLIAAGADDLESGLFTAVSSNVDVSIVQVLLDGKANPRAVGLISGQTPLHVSRNVEIVKALIAAGADVNAVDFKGRTPLHSAVALRFFRFNYRLGGSDFDLWPNSEIIKIIKTLIAAGSDVNAQDSYKYTPIYTAASDRNPHIIFNDRLKPNTEIIKGLVAAGADVMIKPLGFIMHSSFGGMPYKWESDPEKLYALIQAAIGES